MTFAQIQKLIERLPDGERRQAAKRLVAAKNAGWTIFGFWECLANYPVSQWDLVGLDPKGYFEFVPAIR